MSFDGQRLFTELFKTPGTTESELPPFTNDRIVLWECGSLTGVLIPLFTQHQAEVLFCTSWFLCGRKTDHCQSWKVTFVVQFSYNYVDFDCSLLVSFKAKKYVAFFSVCSAGADTNGYYTMCATLKRKLYRNTRTHGPPTKRTIKGLSKHASLVSDCYTSNQGTLAILLFFALFLGAPVQRTGERIYVAWGTLPISSSIVIVLSSRVHLGQTRKKDHW